MKGDLKIIHDASLQVLETTGIRIHSDKLLGILKGKGLTVDHQTVYFKPDQVTRAISLTPPSFKVFARNSKFNIDLTGKSPVHAPAYGPGTIKNFNGVPRAGELSDYIQFIKLYHQADALSFNGGPIIRMADVDAQTELMVNLLTALTYSDKCLVTGNTTGPHTRKILEMLEIVFGGKTALANKPRIITVIKTTSPLTLDRDQSECIRLFVEYGQPFVISPNRIQNNTSPKAASESITQANAEILGILTITQTIIPGSKVVSGVCSSLSHMETEDDYPGLTGSTLATAYNGLLSRSYKIPSMGLGLITDTSCINFQTGWQSMMNYLETRKAGMNIILQSAGTLSCFGAISYEKLIIDLEIMAIVDHHLSGIDFTSDMALADWIKQNSPNFSSQFFSGNGGQTDLKRKSQKTLAALKNAYTRPEVPLSDEIMNILHIYMTNNGVDQEIIDRIQIS